MYVFNNWLKLRVEELLSSGDQNLSPFLHIFNQTLKKAVKTETIELDEDDEVFKGLFLTIEQFQKLKMNADNSKPHTWQGPITVSDLDSEEMMKIN